MESTKRNKNFGEAAILLSQRETGARARAQMVQHLPSKHEALSSNPSHTKKKKKQQHVQKS
jgi:hypothetical protein